jgi:tRNA(fMet)-specific endonuclease VapC
MSIVEKMNQIQIEDMAISIVTIAELQFGAYNSGKVQRNLERIQYLRNIIQTINLDITITEEYAKVNNHHQRWWLERGGCPISMIFQFF